MASAAALGGVGLADTCVPDPLGLTQLCVGWSQPTDPVLGLDFLVAYSGASEPYIFLRTGDADWRISNASTLSGAPANIAQIALFPSSATASFGVSIGSTAQPGARNVQQILLDDTYWFGSGNWLGGSSLNGGRLTGGLKGLVLSAGPFGQGGDLAGVFTVDRDIGGTFVLPEVDQAQVYFGGDSYASILIGSMQSSYLNIAGDLAGKLVVRKGMSSSELSVSGNVWAGSLVSVNDLGSSMSTASAVRLNNFGEPGVLRFEGTLLLNEGIPNGSTVFVNGERTAGSVVDFNNKDVSGWFDGSGGGAGDLIRGGIIRSSGHVWAAAWPTIVFRGTCTFAGMEQFSVLETETSQNDGTFHITGDMNGQMWARASELLENGRYIVDGNIGAGGSLLTSSYGTLQRPGDMKGKMVVGGKMNGNIWISGSLTKGSSIDIGGTLGGGLMVGDETHSTSMIRVGGIAAGGVMELASDNTSCGQVYNANGGILVGDFASLTLQPVVFDGCIRVFGCPLGVGGDFNGKIKVRGCHATAADLNICIDGTLNGAIGISQLGCGNSVTWSCSTCP